MRTFACIATLLLGACSAPRSGLEISALRAARIDCIEAAPVILEGGIWEGAPYVEGGASRPRIGLVEELVVRGEFVEPGREDCAALFWHSTGGSGDRIWLVILESAPERPRSVACALVGDRVQVIHFAWVDEQLHLDVIAAAEGDAACCPGQFERRRYRMVGDELVGFTEIVGRASTKDLAGEVWQLESLRRGDPAGLPFEVTLEFDGSGRIVGESGCNSYDGTVVDTDGRALEIAVRATSARRCHEDQVDMQVEFLRRLDAVSRYSFVNGRLLLQYELDGTGDALTFVPLRP